MHKAIQEYFRIEIANINAFLQKASCEECDKPIKPVGAEGGSAGHSALWSVGIDEGQACYDQNQTKWAVKVSSANEIFQAKEAKKQEQEQDRLMHDVRDIQNYLDKHPEGDTRTGIREALGCSGTKLAGPLKRAIELQLVVEGPIVKGGRRMRGYRLSEYASSPTPDNPDNPDGQPDPP
jgi:hypothetical protein